MLRRGFTLIELLVVIAIIAILAAILFPVFSQAREKARQSQCTSNTRNIVMASQQYAQDYDESLPFWQMPCWLPNRLADSYAPPVPIAQEPYVRNRQVYKCPSTGRDYSWPLACAGDDPVANRNKGWWDCGGAYGLAKNRPDWVIFTSYGYNEWIMNNVDGYVRIARIRTPAEFVSWGDSECAVFTPWGMDTVWGVTRQGHVIRLAWPEFYDGNNVNAYTDANAGRHLKGSLLGFVDGHSKWYNWQQIRMARYGGPLRFMRCDEEPCAPDYWR